MSDTLNVITPGWARDRYRLEITDTDRHTVRLDLRDAQTGTLLRTNPKVRPGDITTAGQELIARQDALGDVADPQTMAAELYVMALRIASTSNGQTVHSWETFCTYLSGVATQMGQLSYVISATLGEIGDRRDSAGYQHASRNVYAATSGLGDAGYRYAVAAEGIRHATEEENTQ